ncbi:hypothetical protein [Vulgatibacter sp.]|uniref:hypothetical protein n=1 Tax=Vulgatibacter sp. TaxID=1971226 RepID=UPI0035685894
MNAPAIAGELLGLLQRAAEDAARLTPALRRLEAPALLDWVAEREAVRERARVLERQLRATLDDGPRPEAIAAQLAAIRREAARLRFVDAENAALAARTLRCVRGYAHALAPTPEAYDRRGLARGAP